MSRLRTYRKMDRWIANFDQGLKILNHLGQGTQRPYPAQDISESPLTPRERKQSAACMRINHAGEIAAQALYHAQSEATAKPPLKAYFLQAAREEIDHLAWCSRRLQELNSSPSRLAPLWYFGSFIIGFVFGKFNDKVSLAFVVETERQVEAHLQDHLMRCLPSLDLRSRAIVSEMKNDESQHGKSAYNTGGDQKLPGWITMLMYLTSRVLVITSRWI